MEKTENKREGGKPDLHEKSLESYNDVFADIVNAILFEGKAEVSEDELEDANVNSVYLGNEKIREQDRDVAKFWNKDGTRSACFGIENQTNSDPNISFRTIGYDGASYRDQLYFIKGNKGKRKTNRNPRYPVVTIVLYFGFNRRWTGARKLSDALMNMPEELKPFVNDYEVHIIEVAWMTQEELERLTSDFRIVADFLVQMRENEKYNPLQKKMIHVRETLGILSSITGDDRFEKTMDLKDGEEEPKTMCEVLDIIENRGIQKGLQKGLQKGEKLGRVAEYIALRSEDGYSAEDIIQGLMKRFQLTKKQAMGYMRQ